MNCDRCKNQPATTLQLHRYPGWPDNWADTRELRCDRCAQELRDYANLGGISLQITLDERLPQAVSS